MFNAKKPDGPSSPANVFEIDRTATAGPATSNGRAFAAHANASEQNCSIINEWLTMRGDLESQGDILVKGKVHGNIQCKLLIVDVDAAIEGGIVADDVVIRGATRGVVRAKRVRLEKTANVDSEIFHDTFSAEEGARIRGSLRNNSEHDASDTAE